MSQHDQIIANDSGANVRADINAALAAIFSQSSGTSAPSTTVAGQVWLDTTNNLRKRRNLSNSGWIVEGTLDESFVLTRTSNTILGVSDRGKTILASGTWTQTFTAVATLGDGWFVQIRNTGTGLITLDPNASEQIDGATTLRLMPGASCIVVCDGSSLRAVGLNSNAPRAWGAVGGSGALESGFNCSSAKTGTGGYTITFTVPMATTSYTVLVTGRHASGVGNTLACVAAKGTNSFDVVSTGSSLNVLADTAFDFVVFE